MSLTLSGNDGLSNVNGTAATPAIRGADSNTGVFFPADNTVAIATDGSQRFCVDPSGNVGIDKTSPQAKLDYRETVNVISGGTTAVASRTYILTASLTLTLPATPTAGDWVKIQNSSGTTTAVVARNGSNIMSLAEDLTIDKGDGASFTLVYADATRGWVVSL